MELDVRSVEAETDQSPVARAQAGDRGAAERLAADAYRMIFRALVRLTGGNSDLAADLTQETYRKAWQSIAEFHGAAQFSSWLYRIAHNTFLNHIRSPRAVVSLDDATLPPVPASDIEDDLFRSEEGRRLRRLVLELPPPQQYVVTAHYWAELSIREIAAAEGVTVVAIRKRLAKALEQLEKALGGER